MIFSLSGYARKGLQPLRQRSGQNGVMSHFVRFNKNYPGISDDYAFLGGENFAMRSKWDMTPF
jgi:hypothetical protein